MRMIHFMRPLLGFQPQYKTHILLIYNWHAIYYIDSKNKIENICKCSIQKTKI